MLNEHFLWETGQYIQFFSGPEGDTKYKIKNKFESIVSILFWACLLYFPLMDWKPVSWHSLGTFGLDYEYLIK